jgi:DNA-binding GntR family transcriptional regulator
MTALRIASETPFDHGNRRRAIVRSVLTDIFQGRLRAGDRLVTQTLANRFGVSHTPIREALIELAGMGVVSLLPNRGAVVRQITAKEVREVCQVRRSLECLATHLACGRIDLGRLHALSDEIRTLAAGEPNSAGFVARARDIDDRLHDLIAASCGNAFLATELARLKTLFRTYRDVAWQREEARNDYHRVAVEAREHLDLLQALLDGNAKAAAQAMARHIRSGEKYWSRATIQNQE